MNSVKSRATKSRKELVRLAGSLKGVKPATEPENVRNWNKGWPKYGKT